MGLKGYRDTVIHARALNAPHGIGFKVDRQASVTEVLLTTDAMNALYDHITETRLELREATYLILAAKAVRDCAVDDPRREQFEAAMSVCSALFRECRKKKLSLPPLPEFPAESALKAARDAWFEARTAEQMAWNQQLTAPLQGVQATAQTGLTEPPPLPLTEE